MKSNEDETFEILKKPDQNQEQTIHRTIPVHQIIRTTRQSQPKGFETFKEKIRRKLNEIK